MILATHVPVPDDVRAAIGSLRGVLSAATL
jgi:hypothetical protein